MDPVNFDAAESFTTALGRARAGESRSLLKPEDPVVVESVSYLGLSRRWGLVFLGGIAFAGVLGARFLRKARSEPGQNPEKGEKPNKRQLAASVRQAA